MAKAEEISRRSAFAESYGETPKAGFLIRFNKMARQAHANRHR